MTVGIKPAQQRTSSQIIHYAGLSDRDRKIASPLPKLVAGGRLEPHVRHEDGRAQTLSIPPSAAAAVEALLAHMMRGERVAVLAEDQELSPSEASAILGAVLHGSNHGRNNPAPTAFFMGYV